MTIYLKLAAALAVIGAFAWGVMADYSAGKKAGQDATQKLWDADKAQIQAVTDQAIAKETKAKEDAIAANEVIANDYQAQLLSSRALSSNLASRLRDAEARTAANSGTVPKAPSDLGVIVPSTTSSVGQLNQLLGATLAECEDNRTQLNSLIAEIKPQL